MRVRPNDGATALPSSLMLALTFNPSLAFAGGEIIGREPRAESRTGRNFEYLGQDPLLIGTLAGATIRGIQSNNIVSTAKHFAPND